MNDRKKLAQYINKQNNKIDKAKAKGDDKCRILLNIEPEYLRELIYYYTEMIGYKVEDGYIYFKHIRFLQDDNLFPELVIIKEK